MNQPAETPWRIGKAAGGFLGGEFFDEESAESLVLAMGGVGGPQESPGGIFC
jgi:hypothetical protein